MGIPVAIGGKRSSRKLLAISTPPDEEDADGATLKFVAIDGVESGATFAATPDKSLVATVSIRYFGRLRVSTEVGQLSVGITAVIQIQIAPQAASFSPTFRSVQNRVHLPNSTTTEDVSFNTSQLHPDAVFAGDGSHLACLVPYPNSLRSVVVIFQLRKPRQKSIAPINGTNPIWRIPPVATNPHLVHHVENNSLRPFFAATCLCDVTATFEESPMSFLLAGCQNGVIHAIAYRLHGVVGLVYAPSSNSKDPVVKLAYSQSLTVRGQLLLIASSGRTTVFQSEFKYLSAAQVVDDEGRQVLLRRSSSRRISEAMEATFRFGLQKQHHCDIVSTTGCWIDYGVLALLPLPNDSNDVVAQVFGVPEDGDLFCHSSLTLKSSRLLESAHSFYPLHGGHRPSKFRVSLQLATYVDYDERSGSVVIASYKVVRLAGGMFARLFSCVWNWSRNVTSLVVRANETVALDESQRHSIGEVVYQQARFTVDSSNQQYLAIISGRFAVDHGARNAVRKDMYEIATMSPSGSNSRGKWFEPSSNVILASSSVFVPVMVNPTARPDFEISWRENHFPISYVAKFGSPTMATIGTSSVAVASTRGVCLLRYDTLVANAAGKGRATSRRWRRFPESQERRIRVVAMALWESGKDSGEETTESAELLLAIVQVGSEGNESHSDKDIYYLSCWSRKWLDLSYQLIHETENGEEFGARLQDGFNPTRISILPKNSVPRHAIVLLSNDASELRIYELRLLDDKASVGIEREAEADTPTFHVEFSMSASGTIRQHPRYASGHSSYLFLAAASFRMAEYVATVGVVDMAHRGLGAVPLSRNAFGTQLISSVTDVGVSILSLSNIVETTDTDSIYYWSIDLCNGKRICWILPRFSRDAAIMQSAAFGSTYQITEGNRKKWLGSVSWLGSSNMWMHGSSLRTHSEWLMDYIPGEKYGFLLRASQGARNILRQGIGGNPHSPAYRGEFADRELFCIGETQVTMPGNVASIVSTLAQQEEKPSIKKDQVIAGIERFFSSRQRGEASRIIITVIVLRVVELRGASTEAERELLSLLYRQVMMRVNRSMDELSMAVIFLSLARQVEPTSLNYLFPLPQTELREEMSVNALVTSALLEGSIGTPSASAQLLSRDASLELSRDLLYRAGQQIWLASAVPSLPTFDSCQLERNISPGLFRFGFRLENAGDVDSMRRVMATSAPESLSSSMIPPSPRTRKEVKGAATLFPYGLFCRTRRRRAENAADEAASEFVMSGFDDSEEEDYEFISMNSSVAPGSMSKTNYGKGASLVEVATEILFKLGTITTGERFLHWKALNVFAKALRIQNESTYDEANTSSYFQQLAKKISTRELFRAVEALEDGVMMEWSDSDIEDRIVDFLVGNITRCVELLNGDEAENIRQACLILVSRLDGRAARNIGSQMLMIHVVSSHVAGKVGRNFVDSASMDHVPLAALYSLAVSELSER